MKKRFLYLISLVMIFSSCSESTSESVPEADITEPSETIELTTFPVSEGHHQPHALNMSQYSNKAKVYTEDDIYIESIQCGYMENLPWHLIIENQEQLDYARERYALIEPFTVMTETYSLDEYTYLLEYSSTGYGYQYYAGGVLIDTEILSFIMAEDCVIPDYGEESPDAIEGYCFLAAVPKNYLLNEHYPDWIYPDRNNMYQDRDYDFRCVYYDTPELKNIYGDKKYLIRTQEEFENFSSASANIKDINGKAFISPLWKIDFERNALLAYFVPMNEKYTQHERDGVVIDGNTISMSIEFKEDMYRGKKGGIYMIYAIVPQKYLTEETYDGWISPELPPPATDEIPEIDANHYSENALILTADDIFIYGSYHTESEFSGKYLMHGEDGISAVWDGLGMYQNQEFQDFVEANRLNFDWDTYPNSLDNFLFIQYLDSDKKLIPYALVIDGNTAEFLYTENQNQPGSYCFYAAVPEELIGMSVFPDWNTGS